MARSCPGQCPETPVEERNCPTFCGAIPRAVLTLHGARLPWSCWAFGPAPEELTHVQGCGGHARR
eukprot:13380489-Alexandrium_andersonii.AAC.1